MIELHPYPRSTWFNCIARLLGPIERALVTLVVTAVFTAAGPVGFPLPNFAAQIAELIPAVVTRWQLAARIVSWATTKVVTEQNPAFAHGELPRCRPVNSESGLGFARLHDDRLIALPIPHLKVLHARGLADAAASLLERASSAEMAPIITQP